MNHVELWWGRFRKCSSSRQLLNQWYRDLLNSKPRRCRKLYTPWPLHKINSTPTHVNAVSLSLIYVSATSALIYISRCFRTMPIIILCRWAKSESVPCGSISECGKALDPQKCTCSWKLHHLLGVQKRRIILKLHWVSCDGKKTQLSHYSANLCSHTIAIHLRMHRTWSDH